MFQNICKSHPLFQDKKKPEVTLHASVVPFFDSTPIENKTSDSLQKGKIAEIKTYQNVLSRKYRPISKEEKTIKEESYEEGLSSKRMGTEDREDNINVRNSQTVDSIESAKQKRDQQKQLSQFYDFGGEGYKNYKYQKVNLERTELSFLQELPLDFVGKGFAAKFNNIASPEITLANVKKQHFIAGENMPTDQNQSENKPSLSTSQIEYSLMKQDIKSNENESAVSEIKQKLKSCILDRQSRTNFLNIQDKIKKNLNQLENKISAKFSNNNNSQVNNDTLTQKGETLQTGSSFAHKNLNASSLSASMVSTKSGISSQSAQLQWISPLLKHENMTRLPNGPPLCGSDYLLKTELLERMDEEQKNKSKRLDTSNINQSILVKQNENERSSGHSDGMKLNVIYINKGLKGKGQKMRSLLQNNPSNSANIHKSISAGNIQKNLRKKSRNMQIAEEYNRLIELQKSEIALANTKRIPTKLPSTDVSQANVSVSSSAKAFSRANDLSNRMLLPSVFLRETTFFGLYLREEDVIRDKIMGAITEREGGISFQRYLEFYQIFAFSQTPIDALISFLIRYFLFSSDSIVQGISVKKLLQNMRLLASHPLLIDKENIFEQWEITIQSYPSINYDMNFLLRANHLKDIFSSQLINPNLILKLLFK